MFAVPVQMYSPLMELQYAPVHPMLYGKNLAPVNLAQDIDQSIDKDSYFQISGQMYRTEK